jgi:hypothetical protein
LISFSGSKSSMCWKVSSTGSDPPALVSGVRHGHLQARADRRQHGVEVVAVDLDEFPLLQRAWRLGGLARKVGEDADDERELLLLNRAGRSPRRR